MSWILEHRPFNREGHPAFRPWKILAGGRTWRSFTSHTIAIAALDLLQAGAAYSKQDVYRRIGIYGPKRPPMSRRAATIAKVKELEREHQTMHLVNRYLRAGMADRVRELGLPRAELRRVLEAGGYSAAELTRTREAIRYYRTKSRRRLWLPEPPGES